MLGRVIMVWLTISAALALTSCLYPSDDHRRPALEYVGVSSGRPPSAFDFGNEKYRNREMFVYRVEPGEFFPVTGGAQHFSAIVSVCDRDDLIGQEVPIFADGSPMRSYSGRHGAQVIEIYIDKAMHTYLASDEKLAHPIPLSEVALDRDICVSLKWRDRVSEPAVIRLW